MVNLQHLVWQLSQSYCTLMIVYRITTIFSFIQYNHLDNIVLKSTSLMCPSGMGRRNCFLRLSGISYSATAKEVDGDEPACEQGDGALQAALNYLETEEIKIITQKCRTGLTRGLQRRR